MRQSLLFSDRLKIAERFETWADTNGVSKEPVSFLAFLQGNYLLNEKASLLYIGAYIENEDRNDVWIHCKGKSSLWYCSCCGEKIIYSQERKTYKPTKKPVHELNKYCRHCGAKMTGAKEE